MQRTTILVPKDKLYPYFGMEYADGRPNEVREDLPESMRAFISDHEEQHVNNPNIANESMADKELKANWYAAWRYPWGAFLTIIYSLAWYRLKLYYTRWKENK